MISKLRDTEGFTLIELLIVVVIIGILAAIAIPQFSNTKEKAFDAAAKSDLRNIMTAEEAYFADNQEYTAFSATDGGTADLDGDSNTDVSLSEGISAAVTLPGSGGGFSATAAHTESTNTFCLSTTSTASEPGEIIQSASC
jgi:type IV pilus assembly protein PilA